MRNGILIGALAMASWLPLQAGAAQDDCNGGGNSPLIVDVHGDGIHLGQKGVGIHFDLYGNGAPIAIQWVRPQGDEAFLVMDLNGNGVVDNGSELFGEGTDLILEGGKAINGYVALQQYDSTSLGGNDDGRISSADAIWPQLRMWTDSDADGKSAPSELETPEALGLVAFDTIPRFSRHVDAAGNTMPFYSWVTRLKGRRVLMVDVFFANLP